MAKLTKFINYAFLKETCDLPQDLADDEFENKMLRAQDTLKMLIGFDFYNAYQANFEANGTAYVAFEPYVKKFLAWQVYEYWVPFANFRKTRAGFRVHVEPNSVTASDIQMAQIIKDARQESQKYKVFMIEYLENNASLYPLYSATCNKRNLGSTSKVYAVRGKHKHDCTCRRCRC